MCNFRWIAPETNTDSRTLQIKELLHLTDPERDQNTQSGRDGLVSRQTITQLEKRVASAMSAYNKELTTIQVYVALSVSLVWVCLLPLSDILL